ncbi:MAG: hypothetical protein HYU24_11050 [Candidatus Rokubacteria bacterium]|nr:hypothetical protein [Candidatus Rokubacteria bacterium]
MHQRGILGSALAAIFVACLSVTAHAAGEDAAVPPNVRIVTPDSSVPPEIAAFSGKWVGWWGPRALHSILVVQKIHPADAKGWHKVEAIYSRGTNLSFGYHAPEYGDHDGRIKDGELVIEARGVVLRYRLAPDRRILQGELDNLARKVRVRGMFTKASE